MMQHWSILSKKCVYDAEIFQIFRSRCITEDKKKTFDFHTLAVQDWVHVIPILKREDGKDEVVLVNQFRHGAQEPVLEFPAGTVEKDELPEVAAMRELEEETGFSAKHYYHLISYYANPAFMNNTTHAYVAELNPEQGKTSFDETEDIDVVIMDLHDLLENPTTYNFKNGSLLTSLFFYKSNLLKNKR